MKKTIFFVFGIAIMFINLCACKVGGAPTPVADAIQEFLNQNADYDEQIKLYLTDYTSFEWDRVLIFNHPTSNQAIEKALGISCDIETDLSAGMIFAKKNEIVYFEYFDYTYWDTGKFIIYPHNRIGQSPHYCVFALEEAIFDGEKVIKEDTNYVYYRLYPVSRDNSDESAETL